MVYHDIELPINFEFRKSDLVSKMSEVLGQVSEKTELESFPSLVGTKPLWRPWK